MNTKSLDTGNIKMAQDEKSSDILGYRKLRKVAGIAVISVPACWLYTFMCMFSSSGYWTFLLTPGATILASLFTYIVLFFLWVGLMWLLMGIYGVLILSTWMSEEAGEKVIEKLHKMQPFE